jgi:acyl-CoA hydrolase
MNTALLLAERRTTAEEAVKVVKSGDRVFVSGNASTPFVLLDALADRAPELTNVEVTHVLQLGEDPFLRDDLVGCIRHNSLFVGPGERTAVNEGRGFYIPIHLHAIPYLFASGRFPIDVAIVHTSPPDQHGYLSLGVEVVTSKMAVEVADRVIAMVNPRMPRTLGDTFVHISEVDSIVECEVELPVLQPAEFGDTEDRIAQIVTSMIPDGATLQMGIGAIPNAVLNRLKDKRDLGIHTEMLTTGMIPLIESGVVTGLRKTINKGKVVCTFAMGTPQLYEYVRDNPIFEFHPVEYVNDPQVIAQHDGMVAVNSAIEIDLTGQVCSDSIGTYIYSGFGGQVDFIRGAAHSKGGIPIIAMPSTAKSGSISRITPVLKSGAGVVTSRADVHWVVTEYGAAQLFGRNLKERAVELINIAHPDFREELTDAAMERNLI